MVSNKPPTSEGNKRTGNQMANRPRFKQGMMNKQQYNPMMNNMRNMSAMFNANQLGDDPGFVDFNDDSVASNTNGTGNSIGGPTASGSNVSDGGNKSGAPFANGNRRMNPPMKRPMKNGGGAPGGGMRNRMNGGANGMPNWGGHPMPPPNMFPGPPAPVGGRRGPMNPPPIPPPVPPALFRNGPGMRMRGHQNGRYGAGPPGPMSLLSMNRPLPPPIPPMNGRQMPPPPGMGRMMPPPLRHGLDGPMRRNMNGSMHARGMGGKMGGPYARNGMVPNGGAIGLNGKRARAKPAQPPNREEYPLDKPWVTAEIRAEHDKKADLANRLKGHRDDALFAQFKEQRDKFVKMYEAARLEYIGKHPEQDVDKILTAPTCKKARLESVEKANAAADSTAAKPEETSSSSSSSSAQVVPAASTVIATDPSPDSTNSDTNGHCATASSTSSPSATAPTDTNDDSAETTPVSSSDGQLSTETEGENPSTVAAPVDNSIAPV